jgi:hypothetical protein
MRGLAGRQSLERPIHDLDTQLDRIAADELRRDVPQASALDSERDQLGRPARRLECRSLYGFVRSLAAHEPSPDELQLVNQRLVLEHEAERVKAHDQVVGAQRQCCVRALIGQPGHLEATFE